MPDTKKKLSPKINNYIQEKYYRKDKQLVRSKPVNLLKAHFDSGLLTPEELDRLTSKARAKYIKNIAKDTSKFAYYIVNVKSERNKWYKLRPTVKVLEEWDSKRERNNKAEWERKNTYWQPLTDAQCHFIFTQYLKSNPVGKRGAVVDWLNKLIYMGKPLSENNKRKVNIWRQTNTGINLDYRPIKIVDNIKPLDILKRQREQLGEQIQKLVGKEKQVLDTLRLNFPDSQIRINRDSRPDIGIEIKSSGSLKENKVPLNFRPANTVATEHGLNSFKTRNNLQSNIEIAETYLKQLKSGKLDYYVNSFQNSVALAEAVGMIPQELFKTLCNQIVKRKKHFKEQEFLNTGNAVAELVETYQTKSQRMMKQGDIKLTISAFFRSEERKNWSKKYNYNWKNRVRFNEEFPKWLKIMTSVATPKK